MFPAGVKKGDTIEPFLCLRRGVSIVAPFPAGTDYFSLPTQRCFNRRGDRHTVPSNFSLPTQRCFHHSLSYSIRSHLFSAYAEMFLGLLLRGRTPGTFLCLRRGVSKKPEDLSPGSFFSLPTQRCFQDRSAGLFEEHLFSAYAEVFPEGQFVALIDFAFLCLRRGVSPCFSSPYQMLYFSLPTQRCFRYATRSLPFFHLFSAYAEVFPACWASRFSWSAFLCLRRGVSYAEEGATLEWVFSLPTQRCFRYEGETRPAPDLFSAYAEVFPHFI